MTYADHWVRVWSLVGALGVGLSFLVWKPSSAVTAFLTAALCAGMLLVLLAPATGPNSPTAAARWSRIAVRAGLVGACVVAVGAFSALVPALAFPLMVAPVLSSPWFIGMVRQWRASRGTVGRAPDARPSLVRDAAAPEDRPAPVPAPTTWPGPEGCRLDVSTAEAEAMTDRELCSEWRHSFGTLQSARSALDLLRVVAQRQIYMDEMERRSPTGLQAWLDSGARAAGGPERFLTKQPRTDDQSDAA